MDKQKLETRLREYSGGACVMSTTQFSQFYGISISQASRKLTAANIEKVSQKWFIPDLADKICKGLI